MARHSGWLALAIAPLLLTAAHAQSPKVGDPPEASNMRLVGMSDLQARSAYQPTIHRQGERYIAYIGHHGGTPDVPKPINKMTGQAEFNGTSILDVTDPANPKYLKHLPGLEGNYEDGGAQMVRVCDGREPAEGRPAKTYMLRVFGGKAHEIWDVTDPANPALLARIGANLNDTHKNWWECDTGIAYLVSGAPGWRTRRMTQVYDLSDPAQPVHIRDFGLPGQEPGTDRHGADRTAWRDLDRPAGQPRLFRLRHQQRRRAADRRSREAAERSEGADAGQSARAGDRRTAHVAAGRRAHDLSARQDAHSGIRQRQVRRRARHGDDRRRGAGERMRRGRVAADGVVRRCDDREAADGGLELHAGGGQFLRARRALRRAFLEREHGAGVLSASSPS